MASFSNNAKNKKNKNKKLRKKNRRSMAVYQLKSAQSVQLYIYQ